MLYCWINSVLLLRDLILFVRYVTKTSSDVFERNILRRRDASYRLIGLLQLTLVNDCHVFLLRPTVPHPCSTYVLHVGYKSLLF